MSSTMPEGRPRSAARLIAGASVAAVLVGALLVSLLAGGDEAAAVTTTTLDKSTLEPLITVAAGTSQQLTTTTTLRFPVEEVRAAGTAALAGWGRFAISGDLTDLDGHFHPDSQQYPILVEKAAQLAADPLGEPPYEFVMLYPTFAENSPGTATMRGTVTATRGGDLFSEADWQMILVWREESQSWLVWTLEDSA